MTQEDKELLLKDLCARLPYGVKVQIDLQSNIYPPISCKVCNIEFTENEGAFIGVETSPDTYNEFREFLCKPYLFPLSSMTEEQRRYINDRWGVNEKFDFEIDPDWGKYFVELGDVLGFINWCYENHLDINGLTPKDLAIDATGLNIYKEE